jgi:hypothetical protein
VEIVRSKRVKPADLELVAALEDMVAEAQRDQADRFHIHRALGKAYDDLDRFEAAMQHFEAANQIARELAPMPYEPSEQDREAHRIKATFTPEVFGKKLETSRDAPTPILIVGMIRSGTTLLDSMLSRLEGVGSAGELRFWNAESGRYRANPNWLKSAIRLGDSGRRYCEELRAACPDAPCQVVDKMPLNFLHLGLVKLAVPEAKIIYMRRHPADIAISIYSSDFGPQPPAYAFEKSRIVHYYRLHLDLMEHWRRVLPPDSLFEIEYEQLVSEPEPLMRQALHFLGIPWSDKVLDRSRLERDVNTPSKWQARQALYTSSVARWRNYFPWLGELSELLSPEERIG